MNKQIARLSALGRCAVAGLLVAALVAGCSGGEDPSVPAPGGVSTASEAPSITAQPEDSLVEAGSSATFTVTASSTEPLAFQWFKNGVAIDGATSDSYVTSDYADDKVGDEYSVLVTNSAGSVTSRNAKLAVAEVAPIAAAQPEVPSVLLGSSPTESPTESAIGSATGSAATSNNVAQTANVNAPKITTQPVSRTLAAGAVSSLFVTASGQAPLSYQWQRNVGGTWTDIWSYALLNVAGTSAWHNSQLRVRVSNNHGSVTSQVVTVTVTGLVPTVITQQPVSKSVTAGGSVTFNVQATGTGPLQYTWYRNGTPVRSGSGPTFATYTVSAPSTALSGAVYSVQVSGAGGTVTSNNATLTVNGSPIGPKFGSVVNLTSLASVDGSRILGKRQDEEANFVFGGCDVNGDKFSDVIVGARKHELTTAILARGAVYVVFGKPGGIGPNLRVADLNGNNGFMIRGADTHSNAGTSVSCAGDVNGDGLGDLLIGATSGMDSGAAYVVFGKIGGFPPIVELASLNGTNGFKIQGGNLDRAGLSVAAGDVNKDGFSDVIVGAFPNSGPGAAFVVFGKAGGFAPTLNVSGLNGANGFKISGEANVDSTGASARLAAADVNGDGFADIILGSDKGAYVVYGKSGGFAPNLSLSGLNGANGSKFVDGGLRIQSVAAVGDINGDKIADFTVGVSNGGRHVVFGKPGGFGATVNLQALGNTAGFKIAGLWQHSTAAGVDLNGDGFSDVVVSHNGHQNKGTVYVIYGKAGGFTNINVSSLNGTNGFRIEGESAQGFLGAGQGAGDYNGDGIHDLLLGSVANFSLFRAGTSYVIYGKR